MVAGYSVDHINSRCSPLMGRKSPRRCVQRAAIAKGMETRNGIQVQRTESWLQASEMIVTVRSKASPVRYLIAKVVVFSLESVCEVRDTAVVIVQRDVLLAVHAEPDDRCPVPGFFARPYVIVPPGHSLAH